jgi:chemotaxis methyl-accepting protein methylase
MDEAMLEKVAGLRILGKSPVGAYWRLNEWIWDRLPPSMTGFHPITSYGRFLHSLVRFQDRYMGIGTFFLRNRPELELIRQLAIHGDRDRPVRIAVLGSSNGAEVYSIAWTIRSARPDLRLDLHAVDVSAEVLDVAREGSYPGGVSGGQVKDFLFRFMTASEMRQMFDDEGETLRIKPWLKEGISWHLGDAADPRTADVLGLQDIVVANRFLCHMRPPDAERCLRGIARLVDPGGFLFVSGVDLDVRTKVAMEQGWKPWQVRIEEIHEGDSSLRNGWPCKYWGLEPIDKRRADWKIRYASVFQLQGVS